MSAAPEPTPRRRPLRAAVLLTLLLACTVGAAADAPRIALVTMTPGELYWTRFGHNALLVVDPESGSETVYNYGIFDFDQPNFMARFLRGHMRYRLEAMPAAWDLPNYATDGREVVVQWLALEADRARRLAGFLADNALPANAEYDYHYFLDNCSTRVRDALDAVLDGALRAQTVSRSRGFTWRAHAARLSAPEWWLWLGIDLGLGQAADRRLSAWDEMFVPMALRDYLRDIRLDGDGEGKALVAEQFVWSPGRLRPPPAAPPDPFLPFLLTGSLVGLLALGLLSRAHGHGVGRILGAGIAALFWMAAGLAGLAMLALWLFTEHAFAYRNENLFLLNPLALVLLPAAWRLLRGGAPKRWQRRFAFALAGLAGAGLLLKGLPFFGQQNAHWIALFLPIHAGIAIGIGMRGNAPAASRPCGP